VSASSSNKDNLLAELEEHLPSPLFDAVGHRWRQLELKIQALEQELRLERIKKYGPKSDVVPSAQLELLEAEPGVSDAEVAEEAQREAVAPIERENRKRRKPHPGRQTLPSHLPRVERVIVCTPEQCVCSACGKERTVIGYDESEQLDVEPAKYFVVRTRREKRACKACEESTVVAAPLADSILPKSLVSDRVILDTVLNKYVAHLPLYRQSALLERDTGVEISRATMDGWVMRVGELLTPVASRMKKELLAGSYIQADETPVAVQKHDGSGTNHQAYLWQYGTPGGAVVFDFRMGRAREGPKLFLDMYQGLLQTDGYAAYDGVGGPAMVHAACWSHARRKFTDALKLNPNDATAARLLANINALFAIDGRAREQKLSHAERHELRQREAAPLLVALRDGLKAARANCLPASATAKGTSYTLSLWQKLTRFLDHPELELSTNLAENSMRSIALGRKNWIHFGHKDAGPRIAAILSVIESCRRLNLNPRKYLADVLPGLASRSIQQLSNLTPTEAARRGLL
jgi:transposase